MSIRSPAAATSVESPLPWSTGRNLRRLRLVTKHGLWVLDGVLELDPDCGFGTFGFGFGALIGTFGFQGFGFGGLDFQIV